MAAGLERVPTLCVRLMRRIYRPFAVFVGGGVWFSGCGYSVRCELPTATTSFPKRRLCSAPSEGPVNQSRSRGRRQRWGPAPFCSIDCRDLLAGEALQGLSMGQMVWALALVFGCLGLLLLPGCKFGHLTGRRRTRLSGGGEPLGGTVGVHAPDRILLQC